MWQIAAIRMPYPVVLAPMAGVTDLPFRLLVKKHGCALVYGPLISAKAIQHRNRSTERLLVVSDAERPVALQIFGSDPPTMAEAARYVERLGPDLIDINMGCPVPKVVDNQDGCALMRDPLRAARVVEAVVAAVRIPVTVKMRKGWDEASANAVEVARLAEAAGASAVCVHGRTRAQLYGGRADWSVIKAVKDAVAIPVIGNGDVSTPLDAASMLQQTGCDAVMIGRAALGNPWIFSQVVHFLETGRDLPPPTAADRVDMAARHFRLALQYAGERAVYEMRKQLAWYLKGLPHANRVKQEIMQATEPLAVLGLLARYRASVLA